MQLLDVNNTIHHNFYVTEIVPKIKETNGATDQIVKYASNLLEKYDAEIVWHDENPECATAVRFNTESKYTFFVLKYSSAE